MNSKRINVLVLTVAVFANFASNATCWAADEAKTVSATEGLAVGDALPAFECVDELAKLLGVPVSNGSQVRPIDEDRKPLLDADGKPMMLPRPVTLARWTIVVNRGGKIASIRVVKNPMADIEEVLKIVAGLGK